MVKVHHTSFNSKRNQAMLKKIESLRVWTLTYLPQERNGEASGKTGKCMYGQLVAADNQMENCRQNVT